MLLSYLKLKKITHRTILFQNVHLCIYEKYLDWMGNKQRKIISYSYGGWEVQNQDGSRLAVCWGLLLLLEGCPFLLCSHDERSVWANSWVLYKVSDPIHDSSASLSNHLSMSHLLISSLGVHIWVLGGGSTNSKSTACLAFSKVQLLSNEYEA